MFYPMAFILFILGIILYIFKPVFLIAGYNTMPKEKKEQYDKTKMCHLVGGMLMLAGAYVAVCMLALDLTGWMPLMHIAIVGFFVVIFGGVIYMNTGKRLLKKDERK